MAKIQLVHIKVNSSLRKRMESLIDAGLFNSYSEIVREGLRDLLSREYGKN